MLLQELIDIKNDLWRRTLIIHTLAYYNDTKIITLIWLVMRTPIRSIFGTPVHHQRKREKNILLDLNWKGTSKKLLHTKHQIILFR